LDLFDDKIEPLLRSAGLSDSEFEKALNLPRSTVYDWRKKRSRSYRKYLPQIAHHLGVSVGFLLSNEPLPDNFSSSPYEYNKNRIPRELMEEIDQSKRELKSMIDAKKQKLLGLIEKTDFSLSQLDMIERIINYIYKSQQK